MLLSVLLMIVYDASKYKTMDLYIKIQEKHNIIYYASFVVTAAEDDKYC